MVFFLVRVFCLPLLLILSQTSLFAFDLQGAKIRGCEDDAEWPPYVYYMRTADNKKTNVVTGFTTEVVSEILKKNGLKFEPELLPWARCLQQVKKGVSFQIAMDATFNPIREKEYLISNALHATNNYYFYIKNYFSKGLNIKNTADLKKYKVCGFFGYDYSAVDLKPEDSNLNLRSKNYIEIFEKLQQKTCDLFVEKIEVVKAQAAIGNNLLMGSSMGWEKIPTMKKEEFHLLISKQIKESQQLLNMINVGLDEMKKKGDLERLRNKYGL